MSDDEGAADRRQIQMFITAVAGYVGDKTREREEQLQRAAAETAELGRAIPLVSQNIQDLPDSVHSLLARHLTNGSTEHLLASLAEVDSSIAEHVKGAENSASQGGPYGAGDMPSGLRYPPFGETSA